MKHDKWRIATADENLSYALREARQELEDLSMTLREAMYYVRQVALNRLMAERRAVRIAARKPRR